MLNQQKQSKSDTIPTNCQEIDNKSNRTTPAGPRRRGSSGPARRRFAFDSVDLYRWVRHPTDVHHQGGDGAMAATLDDVTTFLRMMSPGDLVLVKGSRALELERAVEPLREMGP